MLLCHFFVSSCNIYAMYPLPACIPSQTRVFFCPWFSVWWSPSQCFAVSLQYTWRISCLLQVPLFSMFCNIIIIYLVLQLMASTNSNFQEFLSCAPSIQPLTPSLLSLFTWFLYRRLSLPKCCPSYNVSVRSSFGTILSVILAILPSHLSQPFNCQSVLLWS